jgi:hypothetical protein
MDKENVFPNYTLHQEIQVETSQARTGEQGTTTRILNAKPEQEYMDRIAIASAETETHLVQNSRLLPCERSSSALAAVAED